MGSAGPAISTPATACSAAPARSAAGSTPSAACTSHTCRGRSPPALLLRSGLGGDQVGRNLHLHPAAWIGARYPEEVRGWDGVMQSYYIDQWVSLSILLEATFTPLPFGGAWLLGTGEKHQEAML